MARLGSAAGEYVLCAIRRLSGLEIRRADGHKPQIADDRGLDIAQQDQPFVQATQVLVEQRVSRLPNGGLNRSFGVGSGHAHTH